MKKISKIITTIVLTFLFSISVNAITITTDNGTVGTVDTGSKLVTNNDTITVTGVESGDIFKAYKVVDTFYNSTTNTVTYEFTKDFKDYLTSISSTLTMEQFQEMIGSSTTSGKINTSANALDTLISGYAAYVKTATANSLKAADILNMTVSGTTATLANAKVGSYMVIPTTSSSSPKKIYAIMLGSIALKSVEEVDPEYEQPAPIPGVTPEDPPKILVWAIDNTKATIAAKVSETGISKTVDTKTSTSKKIGDNINYVVAVDIPNFPMDATNKAFKITDVLTSGIELVSTISNIAVKDGTTALTIANGKLNKGTDEVGTISISGNTITVDLTDITKLASNKLNIEYIAKLKEIATLGPTGNANTATLEYANDPYGTDKTTKDSTAKVYTYGIQVNKKDATTQEAISGAEFNICTNVNCTTVVGTIDSFSGGVGYYDGLAEGTYYLVETKAPTGYKISTNKPAITIDTTKEYTVVDFTNDKQGLLPSTGGMGTYIYIGAGALIIVGAILLVYKYVGKDNKKDEE